MKRAAAVVVLLAAGTACGSFGRTARYEPRGLQTLNQPESATGLFARNCAWCHGNAGVGTPRGPSLVEGGAALTDFMLSTGRMPIEDSRERVERRMPQLSKEQIAKIVAYVASLGGHGPNVPNVHPGAGDSGEGSMLYEANCAACHSATGAGGTLARGTASSGSPERAGFEIPGLRRATAIQIAEAIRAGPGGMPVFGPETFTDAQVDSIARYVLLLQRQPNRGGNSLGGIGPVTEGAVAWIIGLGSILLIARWIGKSTRQEIS